MSQILKQSTAATVKLGPFVDDTDGKTAETGLTLAQADIRLSKNGGDIAQSNNSAGATHDELGYYDVPLDTTDTGTLGRLKVAVSKSGALPVWQEFMVVPANVYDSLVSGSDYLQADILQIGGDTQSGTDWKDFADAGYDPATNKVEGVKLVDTTTANTDMRGTDNAALASVCTEARLAELAAANIPADIDTLLARLTAARAGYLDELAAANIPADIDTLITRLTALRAGYLDNLSAGAAALASVCTEARLAELDAANLPADVAAVKADTAAILADTGTDGVIVAAGSKTGYSISGTKQTLDSLNDITAASVWAVATRTLTSFGTLVADIWGALTSGMSTVGSIGKKLSDWVVGNVIQIDGDATAATKLKKSANVIVTGSAIAGTLSTTAMTTDLTEATNDHYIGRIIIWTSGVLKDQATDITAYDGTTKKLTYTATTEAPTVGDTFNIH